MYTSIYQNSYIIFIISFAVLSTIFYFFEIGSTTTIENGKIIKKFSWKYPLAISLVIWLFWHFYLYPSKEETPASTDYGITSPTGEKYFIPSNKLLAQKINMNNWT